MIDLSPVNVNYHILRIFISYRKHNHTECYWYRSSRRIAMAIQTPGTYTSLRKNSFPPKSSFGLRVLSLSGSVRPCACTSVRPCVNPELDRTITRPDVQTPRLRSILFLGYNDIWHQSQIYFKIKIYPIPWLSTRQDTTNWSHQIRQKMQNPLFKSPIVFEVDKPWLSKSNLTSKSKLHQARVWTPNDYLGCFVVPHVSRSPTSAHIHLYL